MVKLLLRQTQVEKEKKIVNLSQYNYHLSNGSAKLTLSEPQSSSAYCHYSGLTTAATTILPRHFLFFSFTAFCISCWFYAACDFDIVASPYQLFCIIFFFSILNNILAGVKPHCYANKKFSIILSVHSHFIGVRWYDGLCFLLCGGVGLNSG